jgi:hypothetical protein
MLSQALTWLCEPPQGNFTLIWVLRRVCEKERLDDQELQSKLLTALAVFAGPWLAASSPRRSRSRRQGSRRYSSPASVPSLTGAGGSSRRPGRVLTPHPGASSCPASRLLESRRVGDGIARWPTGLVLRLVSPGRSERSTHENVSHLRVCRPRL